MSAPATPAESIEKNRVLLQELNAYEPNATPGRISAASRTLLRRIFYKLVDNPIARLDALTKYDPTGQVGFCFGRATAAHLIALQSGVSKNSIAKIFAVGNFNTGKDSWRYHVSSIIRSDDGQWWAIDPIMGDIMPVTQWYNQMKRFNPSQDMKLVVTEGKRFSPDAAATYYSPAQMKNPGYRNYFIDLFASLKRGNARAGFNDPDLNFTPTGRP